MKITPTEAETALASIRQAEDQMHKALDAPVGYQITIWGAIMMVGYTLNHFAEMLPVALVAGSWIVMSILGNVLSVGMYIRMARKFHHPMGVRIGSLWAVFLLFGVIAAFFVHPSDPREINLLVYLLVMLWMAVMGLFLRLSLLWISLTVTGLLVFGFLVLPDFFFLWLGIVGGGAMVGSGLFLLRGRG